MSTPHSVNPELVLGEAGLAINRALYSRYADPLIDELNETLRDCVRVRDWININILDYADVRAQEPIAEVHVADAEHRIQEAVASLAVDRTVYISHVEAREKYNSNYSTLLAYPERRTKVRLRAERFDVLDTLESFVPDDTPEGSASFNWRVKTPAIVVGRLFSPPGSSQEATALDIMRRHLDQRLTFRPADFTVGDPSWSNRMRAS